MLLFILLFISVTVAFSVSYLAIPKIIKHVAESNWLDQPDERKVHKNAIPTMGGIGIFIGFMAAVLPLLIFEINIPIAVIMLGVVVLFITGLADDRFDISAKFRLFLQLFLAFLVAASGIRIESALGLFGIYELAEPVQYILTIFLIAGFINAFNMIDGIDGLAGGIGAINALVLTVLFTLAGDFFFALSSFALFGALIAFLRFNFNPAKIFMGDTGSMLIGFILVVFSIHYLQNGTTIYTDNSTLLVVALLVFPCFDIFRTVLFRVLKGKSPMKPDKSHLHHLLLKLGAGHSMASAILYAFNLSMILCTALMLYYFGSNAALIACVILCFVLMETLAWVKFRIVSGQSKKIDKKIKSLTSENRFLKQINIK